MNMKTRWAVCCSIAAAWIGGAGAPAQDIPQDYQEVLTILGKKGVYPDHVL